MKQLNHSPSIAILIPVYNSEKTIAKLVTEIINELSGSIDVFELILVSNNSTDGSEDVCLNLHRRYKEIVSYYSLSKKVGDNNVIMAGLNQFYGEYCFIVDEDYQSSTGDLLTLINYTVSNDYDVVYTYYDEEKQSFFRNFGHYLNDKILNIILGKPKNLYLTNLKGINNFIVQELIKYDLSFPDIDGLIFRTTNNVGRVKVSKNKRTDRKSGCKLSKLILFWLNLFTNFSILPLRFSVFVGIVFATFGFFLAIQTVYEKLLNPDIPFGYAEVIIIVSIFGGLQLIAIGALGEYIGRIFLSQIKIPQYTIHKAYPLHNEPESEST